MKQMHIFVSGFVQGVGFRQFVRRKAQELGLTGWVKNLPDGRVEAVLQSSASSDQEAKEKIQALILQCKKGPASPGGSPRVEAGGQGGPFLSEVKNVEVVWDPSLRLGQEILKDFKII